MKQIDVTPVEAVGIALSGCILGKSFTMEFCQKVAIGFVEYLNKIGFDVVRKQ